MSIKWQNFGVPSVLKHKAIRYVNISHPRATLELLNYDFSNTILPRTNTSWIILIFQFSDYLENTHSSTLTEKNQTECQAALVSE